jgi:hypothetical protein
MIDMASKGLDTPKFCAQLMVFAATQSGKPLPAAVRKRIEAFKRYGPGKLNESTWTNYEAAARDGNRAEWNQALAVEWEKFCQMGVLEWIVPQPGDKQLGFTTPSRFKSGGEDLHASQFKVRICAQGSSEPLMLDDGTEIETFCPTISTSDLVLFLNMALCKKLHVVQQDLVSAYLHSEPAHDRIVFKPPEFLVRPFPGAVLLAKKSIYGLRSSGAQFFSFNLDIILSLGFKSVDKNRCFFIRDDHRGLMLIATIVDDSALAFEKEATLIEYQNDLRAKGVRFDSGPLSKFGGFKIQYDRDNGTLIFTQNHLIEVAARRFGIGPDTKKVHSPMQEGLVISRDQCPNPHASSETESTMRSLIGSAGYIATGTRPGIKFCVSALSRVADNPSRDHLKAAHRVIAYIYQTRSMPLVFTTSQWSGLDGVTYRSGLPVAWADASLGNSGFSELKRSFGGYVICINGAAFCTRSGLQKTTADSSAKAEVIEIYNATREIVYLHQLYANLSMPLVDPVVLHEDNSAAISIMELTSAGSASRHFEIKYFWVHEIIKNGILMLNKCDTKHMLADIFTKALPIDRYRMLEFHLQGLHALSHEDLAKLNIDPPSLVN